ncbi:MAG: 50S ribosomal protein L25 [bacterium]|nr:50S ribosomal protein L25 [bacterium]
MNQKEKPEQLKLNVQLRTVMGKANKSHRKEGFLPGNIFGKDFTSTAVSVNMKDFTTTFKKAGETSVVYLQLDGKEIPTLIGDLYYHPVTETILHADFRKVNLKQKVEAQVPFVFIGESEAVEKKNGVLLTQAEHMTVSALPADIPHSIEINLEKLAEIGDSIRISDLATSSSYEIMDDPEKTIVSVTEHKEEEIEPETTSEAPEIIGEGEVAEEGSETEDTKPSEKEKEEKNKE